MGLVLVTAPAAEPVTLAEAKAYLKVEVTDDDALLTALITATRQAVDGKDGWLGRALVTQTWDLVLDRFPAADTTPIEVPLPPLQSVASITYVDAAGVTQTWPAAEYVVDAASEPGRVRPAVGKGYPSTRDTLNAVTVRFVAGYTTVPAPITQALLAQLATLYESRATVVVDQTAMPVPMGAAALLEPYRVWAVG